jgi:hypothetical protein
LTANSEDVGSTIEEDDVISTSTSESSSVPGLTTTASNDFNISSKSSSFPESTILSGHVERDLYRDVEPIYDQINQWVKTCKGTHESCGHKSGNILTRLIDVGSLDGTTKPRLVLTSSQSFATSAAIEESSYSSKEYVTRSYCWVKEYKSCILTDENMAERLKSIPFETLPKTIQDAVIICRKMRVRWLWVDALCIIQASKGNSLDWQNQSPRMGQ